MIYTKKTRISFGQADFAGILFFPRYFEVCHNLFEEFILELGFDWHEWFNNPNYIVPFRGARAEFMQSLKGGCEYDVQMEITRLGDSSFEHQYTFLSDLGVHAKVSLTTVFVDRKAMKKMAMPPDVRAKLINWKQN